MSQSELLKRVVEVVTAAGIDYMVTGSIASSLHGEPRSTHDIDLIVALKPPDATALLTAFSGPAYYLSDVAVRDAIRARSMFNLIHLDSGEKVDFWMLTDEPFDRSRFSRRQLLDDVEGMALYVTSPEDTILAKLRWSKLSGGSEKQLHDCLRVYELQRDQLDRAYLSEWSARLDVHELWAEVQSRAES